MLLVTPNFTEHGKAYCRDEQSSWPPSFRIQSSPLAAVGAAIMYKSSLEMTCAFLPMSMSVMNLAVCQDRSIRQELWFAPQNQLVLWFANFKGLGGYRLFQGEPLFRVHGRRMGGGARQGGTKHRLLLRDLQHHHWARRRRYLNTQERPPTS